MVSYSHAMYSFINCVELKWELLFIWPLFILFSFSCARIYSHSSKSNRGRHSSLPSSPAAAARRLRSRKMKNLEENDGPLPAPSSINPFAVSAMNALNNKSGSTSSEPAVASTHHVPAVSFVDSGIYVGVCVCVCVCVCVWRWLVWKIRAEEIAWKFDSPPLPIRLLLY